MGRKRFVPDVSNLRLERKIPPPFFTASALSFRSSSFKTQWMSFAIDGIFEAGISGIANACQDFLFLMAETSKWWCKDGGISAAFDKNNWEGEWLKLSVPTGGFSPLTRDDDQPIEIWGALLCGRNDGLLSAVGGWEDVDLPSWGLVQASRVLNGLEAAVAVPFFRCFLW